MPDLIDLKHLINYDTIACLLGSFPQNIINSESMDLSAIFITVSPALSTELSTQLPIQCCLINESILQGDIDLAPNKLKLNE